MSTELTADGGWATRAGSVRTALGPPRSRRELQAEHERQAVQRRRMAVLTTICLGAWLLGLAGEWSGWLSSRTAVWIYAVAYLTGGLYTAAHAFRELSAGQVGVDLLMITAAVGAATVGEWPEGAFLLFLFSLSNTLERYVLGRTRRAVAALMDLTPEEAVVRRDGAECRVPARELQVGDMLIVRPAERIAADGIVLAGRTSVDQAPVTGESMPVDKGPGEEVFAGSLNQQGAIEVRVTRPAGETTLARIVQLVEQTQSERAGSQRFTEWFGSRYTLAVLTGSALVLAVPVLGWGEAFASAFYRAMTVLVVASPCAVVISIPAAVLAAITGAARNGVLFKGGIHLERIATLRAVVFDKTGTLTVGRPRLTDVRTARGIESERVLALAAAAESLSEHPLARAVVRGACDRGLALEPAADTEALVGSGVRARVGRRSIWVGKAGLFTSRGLTIPPELTAAAEGLATDGKTILFVGDDEAVLGLLAVADTLREGAAEAIRDLRSLGIAHQVMLTGDYSLVARAIARRLGLEYEAELLPQDKERAIRRLSERYGDVAMVGDGINDAPALAAASVGVTLGGSGTDVALETADVVLMAGDLRRLPGAILLGRAAVCIIRQNLLFAFSVMALLLGFTFAGRVGMPLAVVGHEGSTALVVLNGLRLLGYRTRAAE